MFTFQIVLSFPHQYRMESAEEPVQWQVLIISFAVMKDILS